jgi:transposase-like protein
MEAHVRIDEGVKRGKRRKPSDIERKARNEAGQFLTRYSPELKKAAIDDALLAIECGARVEDIATKHNVPVSTMYSWLVGTDAGRIRTQFFDGQAARNLAEIRVAAGPLELARAREELNGWLKVAAVRDPGAYGPKNHVVIEHTGDLGERLMRARERVIEAQVIDPPKALDSSVDTTSEEAHSIQSRDSGA